MTTPLFLQQAIVDDMKELFDGYTLPSNNEDGAQINVFAQTVPYQDTEDETDVFPYIEVRLEDGEDDGTTHTVSVAFVVGVYDSEKTYQGHQYVLNVLDRIHFRYATDPTVKGYIGHQTGKWEWMLQDDSYFPYSFGAIMTEFVITSIRREDPYA